MNIFQIVPNLFKCTARGGRDNSFCLANDTERRFTTTVSFPRRCEHNSNIYQTNQPLKAPAQRFGGDFSNAEQVTVPSFTAETPEERILSFGVYREIYFGDAHNERILTRIPPSSCYYGMVPSDNEQHTNQSAVQQLLFVHQTATSSTGGG